MNFRQLDDWQKKTSRKTNNQLIEEGVKADKISKVRNILEKGIGERCKIIIKSSEQNNKLTNNIEDYIRELAKYGLNPVKELEIPNAAKKD